MQSIFHQKNSEIKNKVVFRFLLFMVIEKCKKMRTKCDLFFFPLCILWDGRLCLSVLSECCTKLIQLPCGSTYWSKLVFYCCEYWTTMKCEEQRLIYVGRNYYPQTVNLTTCGKKYHPQMVFKHFKHYLWSVCLIQLIAVQEGFWFVWRSEVDQGFSVGWGR